MRELPRMDLREKAFRKYESTIAKVCYGEVTLMPEGKKASSFIARFRDAVRGYRLYGYASVLIPPGSALEFKLVELEDGSVRITPKWEVGEREKHLPMAGDIEGIKALCRRLVVGEEIGPVGVKFSKESERAFLQSLPTFYDVAVTFEQEGMAKVR